MKLQVLYFGKGSAWVDAAVGDYQKRMPELSLLRIRDNPKRNRFERMLQKAGSSSKIILLDQRGLQWTTETLAKNFQYWLLDSRNVSFLIGDSDGFSQSERSQVDSIWSLSLLTFPYAITRLIVCEQLYRARSIVNGHPYHHNERR